MNQQTSNILMGLTGNSRNEMTFIRQIQKYFMGYNYISVEFGLSQEGPHSRSIVNWQVFVVVKSFLFCLIEALTINSPSRCACFCIEKSDVAVTFIVVRTTYLMGAT